MKEFSVKQIYDLFYEDLRIAYIELSSAIKEPESMSRDKKIQRITKPIREAQALLDEVGYCKNIHLLKGLLNPDLVHLKKTLYHEHFKYNRYGTYKRALMMASRRFLAELNNKRAREQVDLTDEMEARFNQSKIEA